MAIKIVVALTDWDWFTHLRARNPREVNFWAPSGASFKALRPGEFFLFKLHQKHGGQIVGGGFFCHATALPCSLAWEIFGEDNGAANYGEMRKRIAQYRRTTPVGPGDFTIGCRILGMPFFLDESSWFMPPGWNPNIVAYKGYDTAQPDGRQLWAALHERIGTDIPLDDTPAISDLHPGLGAFRVGIIDAYDRRCAVTAEQTLPALAAARIRPFADTRNHNISNGLLLRRDIQGLFDTGYVTVTPRHNFEVSSRIHHDYKNGRDYFKLHGSSIHLPKDLLMHPDPESLQWHNENRYRG